MGMPNTDRFFLSDKDLGATVGCKFFTSKLSHIECQDEGCRLRREQEEEEETRGKNETMMIQQKPRVSPLKIEQKVKEAGAVVGSSSEKDDDGCRTPKSVDHRIPILICPPAPRKPKSLPSAKRKISHQCRRNVLLNFSDEIDSLFPDLHGKIKKVRKEETD